MIFSMQILFKEAKCLDLLILYNQFSGDISEQIYVKNSKIWHVPNFFFLLATVRCSNTTRKMTNTINDLS